MIKGQGVPVETQKVLNQDVQVP